ncbi:DUF2231 domain-containing protein [Parasphingorhabdus sp.]|uniref:DUF2231 domain-containing protein n=1 Tax=Parasphingorhabdus sp. TaxID=2709688 RepID=UPI003D2E7FAA
MKLRIAILSLLFWLSPMAMLHAHEAHRNNEPDPVTHSPADIDTGKKIKIDQSRTIPNQQAEHGHKVGTSTNFNIVDFLGRLHPAAVHFPIALFLVAALAELIVIINPSAGVGSSIRFLVWTGAAGGVVAAILGWLAGGIRMSDRSEILGLHRWTGTGIAVAGLFLAFLSSAPANSSKRTVFRIGLAGVAFAILIQGYWGAEMSLGPNHMGMKGS